MRAARPVAARRVAYSASSHLSRPVAPGCDPYRQCFGPGLQGGSGILFLHPKEGFNRLNRDTGVAAAAAVNRRDAREHLNA